MKTVLYGWAFDPPHLGHESVIRALLDHEDIGRVVCVPSGYRTEKAYKVAEKHRKAMAEILALRFPGEVFFVDFDCMDGKIARTTTVGMQEYYAEKFQEEPYQVFGTQEVALMGNWYEGERVKREIPKILIVRNGIMPDISELENTMILETDFPKEIGELSSTQIRASVKNTIFSWLCPEIADYIQRYHLYE